MLPIIVTPSGSVVRADAYAWFVFGGGDAARTGSRRTQLVQEVVDEASSPLEMMRATETGCW